MKIFFLLFNIPIFYLISRASEAAVACIGYVYLTQSTIFPSSKLFFTSITF